MSKRNRIGSRRHKANIEQHDGTIDVYGNPTFTVAGDWDIVIPNWPCEVTTTGANEVSQDGVTITTHIIWGSYVGGSQITPNMRLNVDGTTYDVIAAYDPDGDRREIKIESRRRVT